MIQEKKLRLDKRNRWLRGGILVSGDFGLGKVIRFLGKKRGSKYLIDLLGTNKQLEVSLEQMKVL